MLLAPGVKADATAAAPPKATSTRQIDLMAYYHQVVTEASDVALDADCLLG